MFQYIPKHSKLFQNIPNYSKNFPNYSKLFQIIPKYSKIFQNIPKYSKIFQNIPKCSKIFQIDQKTLKKSLKSEKCFIFKKFEKKRGQISEDVASEHKKVISKALRVKISDPS